MHTLLNDGQPFLAKDCLAVGLTQNQLYAAKKAGTVRRMLDRVFVDALAPDTRELRVAGMKLVAPAHAVVADDWASWVYGVDTFKPSLRHSLVPTLVVPHGKSRVRVEGIKCRQAIVASEDLVEIDGLLLTSPVRTAADHLRKKWRPHALAAADAMAHAGLVTMEETYEFVDRLNGYRGVCQARSLAMLIEPKAQSQGESWTRLRIVDAGFAIPESQWEVLLPDGRTGFLDLSYPELLLVIEYDGRQFHTADRDNDHDDGRRRMIEALGFRIIVVTYADIFGGNTDFELELGTYLGIQPSRRRW